VTLELHVVSGRRAGARERFDKSVVSIGRHPLSDLRFDPYHDLDVSTRHAELRGIEGVWTILDQQSTNGTFVNGKRVEGERVVRQGDLLTFGANGPRVEVHITPDAPVPPPAPARSSVRVMESAAAPAAEAPSPDTASRVADAVEAQTRALKVAFGAVMAMLILVIAIVLFRR
jgi:pSer/pThr/pTyr-binding forkhead associated (FHA) protein